MDEKRLEILETRVRGVNRANAYANELWPRLVEVFTPFLGQKIEKVDGPLLAKVQKLVDALKLPCTVPIQVYRHQSNYSLAYNVKTCEGHGGHAYYFEQTLYIGGMRDGHLVEFKPVDVFKTNYTAAGVIEAREAYWEAKKTLDAAQSKLYPFGEYDR